MSGAESEASRVAALAAHLAAAGKGRLGRGLALRHVDAGDCGGCALELAAARAAVRGLARLGVSFALSPREADVLLLSGPLTRNMREAAIACWQAMAEPRWVVALGDCAVDGGVFKGCYAVAGGAAAALPVDLAIPGCPPDPAAILEGLTALLLAVR